MQDRVILVVLTVHHRTERVNAGSSHSGGINGVVLGSVSFFPPPAPPPPQPSTQPSTQPPQPSTQPPPQPLHPTPTPTPKRHFALLLVIGYWLLVTDLQTGHYSGSWQGVVALQSLRLDRTWSQGSGRRLGQHWRWWGGVCRSLISLAFRHLPPNSARTGHATDGPLDDLYLRAAVHRRCQRPPAKGFRD